MNRLSMFAAAAALASALSVTPAAALVVQHIATDAELLALLSDELFVAEGRIGDGAGAATFEIDLGGDTGAPATSAQYAWPNGGAVNWTLHYNNVTNLITFTVDTVVLQWTTPLSGFTDLFVRTRAVNADTEILVDDLVLDAENIGDASHAVADGLDILWIAGGALADGFTLTGTTTMSWGGAMPTQSRLAFQIKVGVTNTVPTEQSTWGKVKALYR
ncbi:MAG: hypothetical protein OEX18_01155 [Candidatus Krumholzibacteria bacterium]|nr:hypothetical protein [Candidatus Krumholzibacteria bacterium]MDH4335873.1 hypothetical protein [Candidatus Krumholzibacteria bacterium]MDH5270365.1 hypothetical protein [Candidatus Krumholzibacteria bacterium]MDH5626718.1 hypothetical protein [Candidatus Krumholzibacteria bacterium]